MEAGIVSQQRSEGIKPEGGPTFRRDGLEVHSLFKFLGVTTDRAGMCLVNLSPEILRAKSNLL